MIKMPLGIGWNITFATFCVHRVRAGSLLRYRV
jgi:hypothetical protein